MSARANSSNIAACISAAVCTLITLRLLCNNWVLAAVTNVTFAPRWRAACAIAIPCLPVEGLPIKRTGSINSRVPPALTSTVLPCKSCLPWVNRKDSKYPKINAGSAIRPVPTASQARMPSAGAIAV